MCEFSECRYCKGWDERKDCPKCKVNDPEDWDEDNPCPDYEPKSWGNQ